MQIGAPEIPAGRLSGSWYDPTHSGEGYVLEVLADQRALVYWFSFDGQGQRRWFFGTGAFEDDSSGASRRCSPRPAACSAQASTRRPSPSIPGDRWSWS
jgi:hypothetical protein